jgi:lysophospholipid acyltransferase (LPLAT)-like uncharacterized protein
MSDKPAHRKQRIIGRLAYWIYRLYSATFRYRIHGADEEAVDIVRDGRTHRGSRPGKNVIFAFWHQDELAFIPHFGRREIVVMVSDSRDGTIMATALECFGYQTTKGSSTRGGARGFIASIRMMRKGYDFTMAVDGPKGPIYKVKEGIVRMAEKSGRPIIPLRAWPERYKLFHKAWNQAKLPLPFSKIHIMVGEATGYTADELEAKLNSMPAPF